MTTKEYLFSFSVEAHSSNIERNLTTKGSPSAAKKALWAILSHGANNGLPYIIEDSSLQSLFKNLTRDTNCCSQNCAAEGSHGLHLRKKRQIIK